MGLIPGIHVPGTRIPQPPILLFHVPQLPPAHVHTHTPRPALAAAALTLDQGTEIPQLPILFFHVPQLPQLPLAHVHTHTPCPALAVAALTLDQGTQIPQPPFGLAVPILLRPLIIISAIQLCGSFKDFGQYILDHLRRRVRQPLSSDCLCCVNFWTSSSASSSSSHSSSSDDAVILDHACSQEDAQYCASASATVAAVAQECTSIHDHQSALLSRFKSFIRALSRPPCQCSCRRHAV